MAKMHCIIPSCGKPACNSHGWCGPHYKRWLRHGDPNSGRVLNGETKNYLNHVVISYKNKKKCLIWPFAKSKIDGRPVINNPGGSNLVHRIVCEAINGPPPTNKHQAAHSCGNGHLGCVNPHHLRWATQKENEADRVIHGTSNRGERHGMAKLKAKDVLLIRKLAASKKVSGRQISARFGVSQATVSDIIHRRSWGHLT